MFPLNYKFLVRLSYFEKIGGTGRDATLNAAPYREAA